jgi:hypothetical protein
LGGGGMTIISHAITAAEILSAGIAPALESRAVVEMNARILGAIRYAATGDDVLARCIDEKYVVVAPTEDPKRFTASLLVREVELAEIERHLLAIREDSVELGLTAARVKYGFSRFAVDAAVESVQYAKYEFRQGDEA